jgi:biopolymer transport protein ExbD
MMVVKKLKVLLILLAIAVLVGIFVTYFSQKAYPKLASPPTDVIISLYVNQTGVYYYESRIESLFTTAFKVSIDYFSNELKLLTMKNETITRFFPYMWEVDVKSDGNVSYGFYIVAPHRTGNYTIYLRLLLSSWIFSHEYRQTICVKVLAPQPPQKIEPLKITLDKQFYFQGEYIVITIKNNLNESILFANTAYELHFEIFNGTSWVRFKDVPGKPETVSLDPGESVTVRDKLDDLMGRPFPPGRYRVGTKDVYANFEVSRPTT